MAEILFDFSLLQYSAKFVHACWKGVKTVRNFPSFPAFNVICPCYVAHVHTIEAGSRQLSPCRTASGYF